MSEKNEGSEKEAISKPALIAVIVSIFVLWMCTPFLVSCIFGAGTDPNIRGVTGDMFGVTNTLFSGLALAGIIVTLLMQRRELELQRRELEDTREVFNQQKISCRNSLLHLLSFRY